MPFMTREAEEFIKLSAMEVADVTKGVKNGVDKALGWGGKAINLGFMAMTPYMIGHSIATGENSVGGSIGEMAGGLYGWQLGDRLMKNNLKFMKPAPGTNGASFWGSTLGGKAKWLGRGALGLAGGIAGSVLGSLIGGKVGDTIAPFRRAQPQQPADAYMSQSMAAYQG